MRVFSLNFPGLKAMIEADTYAAGRYIFSFHDYYHCMRNSFIPHSHRLSFIRIANVLKNLLSTGKEKELENLKEIATYFIDQDMVEYLEAKEFIDQLERMNTAIFSAEEVYQMAFLYNIFSQLSDLTDPILKKKAQNAIITDIMDNQEDYVLTGFEVSVFEKVLKSNEWTSWPPKKIELLLNLK